AAASVAPSARSSAYRSSRCCDSSSTISACRAGGRCRPTRRRSIARQKSGILDSGNAVDRGDELAPRPALRLEDGAARGRQTVVPAAALPRLLHPAPLNPSTLFEPVQQRIERGDPELEDAARTKLDQLA